MIRSLTPSRPYHVQWLLTRKCNYRCRGCDVWRQQDERELSTEEVKRGLDVLKGLGVVEVVLSGGDPLLRSDIAEIIEYSSRFFITTVYDNGSMALRKIDALRKADFVAISIDSLDPEKNDYLRGIKNAWSTAMETVERLHEEGISVGVSPTISQLNLYEIPEFTSHFLSKGVPVWYSLYSYDSPNSQSQLFKIGKRSDEFTIVDRNAMINLCDSVNRMRARDKNLFMTTRLLKAVRNLYSTGERTWKCRALQGFFVVDHLGRVSGCHIHDPVASIFDLPRAWNSARFNALRRTYKKCMECNYLCYMFYSLHGGALGNLRIAQERWRSSNLLLKRKGFKPPYLAKQI